MFGGVVRGERLRPRFDSKSTKIALELKNVHVLLCDLIDCSSEKDPEIYAESSFFTLRLVLEVQVSG